MAHGRADGGSFSFDLIPDDDEESYAEPPGSSPGVAHGLGRAMGELGSRVRSWPRRRVITVATVVGVLAAGGLGTAAVTAQARQRAWAQTAATAPGAVLNLDHEPVEAWRIELGEPVPIALVDGRLIVQEQQDGGAQGPTLHGIDLEAGEIAWSTTVPGASECTVSTQGEWWGATQRVPRGEAVVCLSGGQRTVSVVDRDGHIVASRQLADAAGSESAEGEQEGGSNAAERWSKRVLVMPSAGLLRIGPIGPAGPPPAIGPLMSDGSASGARSATLMEPFVNRDVRVRLEDAATGAVRWEAVLDAADLPAGGKVPEPSLCLVWQSAGEEVTFDPDAQWIDGVGARTLSISMCGLDVDLDLETGEILEQDDAFAPSYVPGRTLSSALVDGGWVDIDFGGRTSPDEEYSVTSRVMRADGSVIGEVPAIVFPPLATDGPASALLTAITVGADGSQSGLAAYGADDASLRWSAERYRGDRILARTVDVVVVTDGAVVTGLDWETGETLWEHALYGDDVSGDGGYSILDAVTDGRRVAVVAPRTPNSYDDTQSGPKNTTALDLATGEVVWTATGSEPVPFAIAGGLYRFENDALVALE